MATMSSGLVVGIPCLFGAWSDQLEECAGFMRLSLTTHGIRDWSIA
jgi:hypothetical protein